MKLHTLFVLLSNPVKFYYLFSKMLEIYFFRVANDKFFKQSNNCFLVTRKYEIIFNKSNLWNWCDFVQFKDLF